MATSSANNHHTLNPFLLYLSSSVIFPGLPLAPHTQGTPNKKSILSTRQCHHNYSSQTAIEDKLHLHCLFTRSLWLSCTPPPTLLLLLFTPTAPQSLQGLDREREREGYRETKREGGHDSRWDRKKDRDKEAYCYITPLHEI